MKLQSKEGIALSGLTKKEHYSWDDMDDKCAHMRLQIDLLKVDNSYQRGEASNASTIDKAKHMQHAAMGAIVVGKREDGSLWIVDGLQRALAAKRRGDITEIDCMVFESAGSRHEAEVFLLCNKGRVSVTAKHKYRTSVIAGRSPEAEIDKWLTDNGYSVADQSGEGIVRFPAHLVLAWKLNEPSCKQALQLTSEICQGEPNCYVFDGIATLIRHGVNVRAEVKRLISMGGQSRLLKEINTIAITLGSAKSWRVCALGVLAAINYKRSKKIRIESWEK